MKGLIVTYLLAYGGAAVALFNPFLGVCVYWLFDIVRPQYMFGWAGAEGSFSQIIAMGTIAGWALKGCGSWRFGKGKLLMALLVAQSLWVIFSAIAAPDSGVATLFLIEQAKRVIMFVIAVTLADSVTRVVQLAWVITASAGYLAFELNMRYFRGFNEVHMYGYGGMDNNCVAISMVTCLGVSVFLGLYVRPLWQKAAAFGASAFIGHLILLTFSRGGMLGLIIAGIAAAIVVPKRPKYLVSIVAALVLAMTLAGDEVRARFMSSFADDDARDYSAQSRVDLWLDCVEVMKKYPILGAGPDHFALIVEEFGWPPGKEAHSLWFQLAAEIGVLGSGLLLVFYLTAIRRLWPYARLSTDSESEIARWTQHAACMIVTALVGFIVSVQFVTLEGLETPFYVVAIAVGTLRLATVGQQAATASVPAVPRPHVFIGGRRMAGNSSATPRLTSTPTTAGRLGTPQRPDSRLRPT